MKYFTDKEFDCPCCNQNEMDGNFLDQLDKARGYAGTSFVISSGYRCPAHNGVVGGSITSSHLEGEAADIVVRNSNQRCKILSGLIRAGFIRIGIGKTFIHVDNDYSKTLNVVWLY
jgi:uncharacterized protein YcbK (DUF882 family)